MSELIIERSLVETALEAVGDGWTIFGRAVPYGVAQRVDDGEGPYLERFAASSFIRDVEKGGRWVNLMLGHRGDDGDRYLGRCVQLEEHPDGLYCGFRLVQAHPQAQAAKAGELTGWSVGARVYRSRKVVEAGVEVVEREVCGLNHVAATASPQYAGAGVMVAREHVMAGRPAAPLREKWAAKYLQPQNAEHQSRHPAKSAATRP